MPNPQKIINRMETVILLLEAASEEMVKLGKASAEANGHYRVAKAKKTLELKQEGFSVGLIDSLVRGDRAVVKSKWEYDVAVAVEKACMQRIKNFRTEHDGLRSELAWNKAEMTIH